MKPKRKKEQGKMPPKKSIGDKKSVGHGMGGLFGVTPKKPEIDNKPQTRSHARSKAADRLKGVRI